jgi:hypothetical protein
MHSTQENVAESLALVNVVRQAFGAEMLTELPDSQKGNSSDCLYYRALKDVGVDERTAAVVAGLWGTEANGSYVKAPEQFGQVIGEFDGGKLGHYTL